MHISLDEVKKTIIKYFVEIFSAKLIKGIN